VEHVPQLRVLLLVTARSEFKLPWPSYPHMTTFPLARLGRHEGAALVERVTSGKRLPKEVMDEILARTDGVPTVRKIRAINRVWNLAPAAREATPLVSSSMNYFQAHAGTGCCICRSQSC
jgi:hypothetical protein